VSIDRRLREDLERDAARVSVDVERNLGAVEGRARHRPASNLLPALAAAAIIAVAIAVRLPSAPSTGSPTAAPSIHPTALATTDPGYAAIAGTYRVALDAVVDGADVRGTWTMELVQDGELVVSPPPTFAGPSQVPTGVSFSLAGDRFRTDLFYNDYCRSVGTYTWSGGDGALQLVPVQDDCAIRRAVLGTTAWTELP
jgi:hypothetical protein